MMLGRQGHDWLGAYKASFAKAQGGAETVKQKAAQGGQDSGTPANHSDAELPEPAVTEDEVDMKPAHPGPDAKDMKN